MKIEHLAIWVKNLENMKEFYMRFFKLSCSKIYINNKKNFSSYFLSFEEGTRLELMHSADISTHETDSKAMQGFDHFAVSVGSTDNVNELTEVFRSEGYEVVSEPRTTGDGYYESVILDPEGNHIELTT